MNEGSERMKNYITRLPASNSVRRAIRAAWDLLEKIENMTTDEFSRGGEKAEREALRAALAKIEKPGKPRTRKEAVS